MRRLAPVLMAALAVLACDKGKPSTKAEPPPTNRETRTDANHPRPDLDQRTSDHPETDDPGSKGDEPAPQPSDPEPATATTSPELDALCKAAADLNAEATGASKLKKMAMWRDRIQSVANGEIKRGFKATLVAAPEMRYKLAQAIAKEAGHPDWHCPAMAELYQSF